MKRQLTIFGLMINCCFVTGQVITSCDLSDHSDKQKYSYKIDTLKIQNDTTYVTFRQFYNNQLEAMQDEIYYKVKANCADCKDTGQVLTVTKAVAHGHAVIYYSTGQRKCAGTYIYGLKKHDWKYWDESGAEMIQIRNCNTNRTPVEYYIDGEPVKTTKRKKKK